MAPLNPWRRDSDSGHEPSPYYDWKAIGQQPQAVYRPDDHQIGGNHTTTQYEPKPGYVASVLPPPPPPPPQLGTRIVDVAKEELFYTITDPKNAFQPRLSVLNLSTMNRILLHKLQHDLAKSAEAIHRNPELLLTGADQDYQAKMRDYCEAIKNMSFMQSFATAGPDKDPFKLTSDSTIERAIMEEVGLIPNRVVPFGLLPLCSDATAPRLLGNSRSAALKNLTKQQMLSRFVHAFGGGLALIIPMLIMVFVDGTAASVTTTCVSMALFALVIALKSNLGPNEVLAVTSAYAAVLVVFVGVRLDNLSK